MPGFVGRVCCLCRISRLTEWPVDDLLKSVESLYRKSGGKLRGLILDLRNNPGGVLHTSIGAASLFLPPGVVVVSDRGRGRDAQTYTAESHSGFDYAAEVAKVPMVILVNEGSASAAEIVAGALQDHDRAVLLGTRTYGKASVQSLLPLRSTNGKTAIKLTTARYYTPNGNNIQARGIEPDIMVEAVQVESGDTGGKIEPLREADLDGHLSNDNATEDNKPAPQTPAQQTNDEQKAPKPQESGNPFIPVGDRQYEEALKTLKAKETAKKQPVGNIVY